MAQVFDGSESYGGEPRPVLTIGNFDGLHLGHRELVGRLVERARALDAPAAVYTFEPAPRRVLQPGSCPPRILAHKERLALLGELGVDHIIVETFTRELAARPPRWFAEEILGRRLRPVAMVVGHDFRYGRARKGDAVLLREQLPGLPVETVDALLSAGGVVVSSSRIREAVAEGRMADAAALLGRPYHLRGLVVRGEGRGRGLGYPTANLHTEAELLPPPGVYAVRAGEDQELSGIANLGVRPTFGAPSFAIEVHLFDLDADLYGQELRVSLVQRLREERRFDGVEALLAQIRSDVTQARAILA